MNTLEVEKIGLDAWYDKRLMLDRTRTEPYGLGGTTKKPIAERLEHNLRTRAKEHGIEYELGCEIDELIRQIESQFKIGMCWRNYGVKWELNHIILVSYVLGDEFQVKTPKEQQKIKQKIVNYTNIQPLFNSENAKKRDKLTAQAVRILDK